MQEDGRRDYYLAETGVLIIGGGAAGLRAAIELKHSGVDEVLVLGKRRQGDAHTIWAAGGINAVFGTRDPDDRWDIHAADTLAEGHYLSDPGAVETLSQQSPARVKELYEWGCPFTRTEDGEIEQRFFGAQTYRRACFAGDRTGEAILHTLVDKARQERIPYRDDVYVSSLLQDDGGRVVGAAGFGMDGGEHLVFRARAVVLAAGGYTSIYSRSSSRRDENTGDAVALAYEAGADLRDMEFVQFHPTGFSGYGEIDGKLVTEAVRGEGGRLYNREGERFMKNYSPEQMELDARDVVARANYREIQEGRGTGEGAVSLDISHLGEDYIKERLPAMYEAFRQQGVDISREPMKVAPTAHYAMGGIRVDFEDMSTSLEGLYAVGEATSGVHGANRLGGNSLAETLVFGRNLGQSLAQKLDGDASPPSVSLDEAAVARHFRELDELASKRGAHDPQDLIGELRDLLWEHGGIIRNGESLREGLQRLEDLAGRARDLDLTGAVEERGLEYALNLRAMLTVGEAILRGALMREESRGAHWREEHPAESEEWKENLIYAKDEDGSMRLRAVPVAGIPPEIQKGLQDQRLSYHHLE